MNKQTSNYRIDQFKKTDKQESPYKRTLKVISSEGHTNYLDISEKEYEQIKNILTNSKKVLVNKKELKDLIYYINPQEFANYSHSPEEDRKGHIYETVTSLYNQI